MLRPFTIVIISPEYPPHVHEGGLGTHVRALAVGLAKQGHKVLVFCNHPRSEFHINDHAVEVHYLSCYGPAGQTQMSPSDAERVNEYFVNKIRSYFEQAGCRPDVIHCHGVYGILATEKLASMYEAALVSTVHIVQKQMRMLYQRAFDPIIQDLETRLVNSADRVIAVSHCTKRILEELYECDGDKIQVVYNSIDPEWLEHRATADDLEAMTAEFPANKRIVMFAGRLVAHKGPVPLLRSAEIVVRRINNVVYAIAGSEYLPEDKKELVNLVQESAALRDNVFFVGQLPRWKLSTLYQIADLAVVPSRHESFGYAAVEAMSRGVPTIATDTGGLREILTNGVTGLLVPLDTTKPILEADVQSLADAQMLLLEKPCLARRLADAGREFVTQTFTARQMIAQTEECYTDAIASAGKSLRFHITEA